MRVSGLWRYPVKSMFGERLPSIQLDDGGVEGDRRFGVLDLASGTILSAKREGRLLQARALLAGVTLTIRLPTGETALGTGPVVDLALSGWLGRPVTLVGVRPEGRGTYQAPSDFEDDDSPLVSFDGPYGSFVDGGQVHLVTSASIRGLSDERPDIHWEMPRFRPNVLIEVEGHGPVEQDWIGRRLEIGDAEVEVDQPCARCVMVTRPQPGGIERELDVLRHINAKHGSSVGVLAHVTRPGRVDTGRGVNLLAW